MNRWSLSRLFRSVSADDFREAVNTVSQSMEESCGGPIAVEIKCYNDIKHSITMWDEDLQDQLDEQNKQKVFQELSSANQLTDELWLKSKFIEAVFHPVNADKTSVTFAVIEAKGLRPKQIGFYVQPEQTGGPAQAAAEEKFNRWIKGDGYASNHTVSLR